MPVAGFEPLNFIKKIQVLHHFSFCVIFSLIKQHFLSYAELIVFLFEILNSVFFICFFTLKYLSSVILTMIPLATIGLGV